MALETVIILFTVNASMIFSERLSVNVPQRRDRDTVLDDLKAKIITEKRAYIIFIINLLKRFPRTFRRWLSQII